MENERPYVEIPYKEYKLRVDRCKELMEKHKVDALLVFSPTNIRYYTGLTKTTTCTGPWLRRSAVIPLDGDPVLIGNYIKYAAVTTWVNDIRERVTPASDSKPYITLFLETIKDLEIDNKVLGIGLDPNYPGMWALDVSPQDIALIKKGLPNAKFVNSPEICWEQRMIKTDYEIKILRECCDITAEAFKKAFAAAKEGVTEAEINQILWQIFLSKGGLVSDAVLVGRMTIDAYGRLVSIPLKRKLERGDQITYNGGACYRGYHSDVSRVLSVGEPSEHQRILYEAARIGGEAAMATLMCGNKASDVYNAAIKAAKEFYPKIKPAWVAVGHGIGMDSHEPPYLAPDVDVVLRPGMVLAIEVLISDPENGLFGGTTEDDFVITEDGYENLTGAPTKLPRRIFIV